MRFLVVGMLDGWLGLMTGFFNTIFLLENINPQKKNANCCLLKLFSWGVILEHQGFKLLSKLYWFIF